MPRLCVLLVPAALEALDAGHPARELHRADGVVAVEPARVSHRALGRLPGSLTDALAALQARRLLRALPGEPAVVVLFEPAGYPLARGLLAMAAYCELWYAGGGEPATRRLRELDRQARERSARPAGATDELWQRLAELGVDVRVSAPAASRSGS